MTNRPCKWTVGDKAVVIDRGTTTGVVTKVGRKLVTVAVGGKEFQFNIDDGSQAWKVYGSPAHVRTSEQHASIELRTASSRRLSDLTDHHYWIDSLTVAQMDSISQIIESAAKGTKQ